MTEEIETQENNKLPVLRGELALLVVVLIIVIVPAFLTMQI